MANLFAALNNNFKFELPEGLWDESNFIKTADAFEKYKPSDDAEETDVIPVIGYGITKIDKEKHPDAVSERSAWVATEEEIINVPSFQLPDVEIMLREEQFVEACQNGLMGIKLVPYDCQYGHRVKIEWCDR